MFCVVVLGGSDLCSDARWEHYVVVLGGSDMCSSARWECSLAVVLGENVIFHSARWDRCDWSVRINTDIDCALLHIEPESEAIHRYLIGCQQVLGLRHTLDTIKPDNPVSHAGVIPFNKVIIIQDS